MRAATMFVLVGLSGCSLIVPSPDEFTYDGEPDAGASDGGARDAGSDVDAGDRDAGPMSDAGPDAGCTGTEMLCSGSCVDTQTSVEHCGRCDAACETGWECRDGDCFDPVIDVSSGPTHSCARRASGQVICWGYNAQGQIGDGSVITRPTPVEAPLPMGSEQVVAGGFSFSSGNGFTCSRDRTGTSTCWGAQSGMMPLIRSLTPTAFTILSPATHLDLGDGIGCGILASGRLNCWGTLSFDMAVSEPTDISPSGLSGSWVATVDVGVRHMCATSRDGRVFCMGDNSLGQLGQDPASLAEATTLVEVAGLTDAEEVAVSGAATCVRRTGGRVSCWGAENMLGIGSGASVAHPAPVDVPGVTDAQSVVGAAGIGTATCALRADDTLTCWGYDFRVPITGDTAAPDPYTLPGAADVSQFSVGTGYMCLVHREGTANCIGRNFWGTLGDGTTTDSERLVQVALP